MYKKDSGIFLVNEKKTEVFFYIHFISVFINPGSRILLPAVTKECIPWTL